MNPLKNKMFLRALGILIFLIILLKLDIEKTTQILRQLNIRYFLLALTLFIPHLFFKIYRWHKVLQYQRIKIKFTKIIHPYIGTYGLGIITPWKVGELARIFYLRKKKVSLGAAAFSILTDRLFDVLFFLIIGTASMFLLFTYFKDYLMAVSIILIIGVILMALIIYNRHKVFRFASNFFIPNKIKEKTKITAKEMWDELKKLKFISYIELLSITALSMVFFYFEVYLFSIALNISLSFWQVIILVSIASIANLLPITVSGIGTRDATFVFLFSIFGLASEQAIALSLLILFMWAINALFCMVFWWEKPIEFSNS